MIQDILKETKPKIDGAIVSYKDDLRSIQTGRASSALVDDIMVNHYNSLMPLKQVATVATPSATQIIITPWDKGALAPIETAIKESDLDINPINDGAAVRLNLPPMSQERREDLAKLARTKAESARISVRNIREEAWKKIQKEEKAGDITEDDLYAGQKDLQKVVDDTNKVIEDLLEQKEKEIKTV